MIGFRLDGRSNVVPYLQLVDQVRQALRTGLLEPGDQLPTVREVAESVAINPNTVLKAYRQLEHEGLVEGRPGQGTFVVRSLAGPSLASHAALRRSICTPGSTKARGAGLGARGHRGAVRDDAPCLRGGGRRVSVGARDHRSRETLRTHLGAARLHALRAPRSGRRSRRPQRRRARRPCCGSPSDCAVRPEARSRCSASAPRDDAASLARVGFVAQETPLYRDLTRRPTTSSSGVGSTATDWDRDVGFRTTREALDPARAPGRRALRRAAVHRSRSTMALAKRPELLVLDEPVASLDPLARRTFLAELMGEVAASELTVLLSSHVIADLEHRCDYLMILSDSRVQVLGDVDDLLAVACRADRVRTERRSRRRRHGRLRHQRAGPAALARRCATDSADPDPAEVGGASDLARGPRARLSRRTRRGNAPGPRRCRYVIWLVWRQRRGSGLSPPLPRWPPAAAVLFITGSVDGERRSTSTGSRACIDEPRRRQVRAGRRAVARMRRQAFAARLLPHAAAGA